MDATMMASFEGKIRCKCNSYDIALTDIKKSRLFFKTWGFVCQCRKCNAKFLACKVRNIDGWVRDFSTEI